MSADYSTVTVAIHGRNYTLALDQGHSAEGVRQVAQLVDERLRAAAQEHPAQSPLHTAVLAGLNLVDELFALQAEYASAESDIARRTSRLTASLERLFTQVDAANR